MTDFEVGLINALEQMGNTDWVGIVLNIIGTLIASAISALVAFKMAKDQTEKQITKQNSLEIKREKRMLATQIRLDKYEDLYASLTEYMRLVNESYLNVIGYIRADEFSDKVTIEKLRIKEEDLQQEMLLKSRKVQTLSVYHPEIINEWVILNKIYNELANIIYDHFTYPGSSESKGNSFVDLREKLDKFDLQGIKIQDMLTNAIIKIIKDLESNL